MSGGQWITRITICHLVWIVIVLRTFFVTPPYHYLCGLIMICYKQSLLSTQTSLQLCCEHVKTLFLLVVYKSAR